MTLHAESTGSGPTLVLLHGFTGGGATWAPFRDALARRWRILAVDLPGHGRSSPPAGDLVALAQALVGLLDRHGVARAHWLGYSLGGRAALHIAVAHPARVDRLVLESTSAGIADGRARAMRAAADAALADDLVRDGLDAFVDRWIAQPLFATQRRLPRAVRGRERALRTANTAAGLAAALRAYGPGTQAPLWDRLAGVRARTLLVVGEDDGTYRGHAGAMAAALPDAAIAVVPAAGHATHLENPAAFLAAVTEFLAAA